MTEPLWRSLACAAFASAAWVAGGTVAAVRSPLPWIRSYVQHFAAGIVFSAVAVEILPDVIRRRAPVATGMGFVLGVVLMLALAAEFFSLSLATGWGFHGAGGSSARTLLLILGPAAIPLLGTALGAFLLSRLSRGAIEGVLAFACAAFLYLVTEELLVEAHEVPQTAGATSMFFAGFLLLLMIQMLTP